MCRDSLCTTQLKYPDDLKVFRSPFWPLLPNNHSQKKKTGHESGLENPSNSGQEGLFRQGSMSENTGFAEASPLLEGIRNDHGGERKGGRWWNRVLDVEEARIQLLFGLPMILTNVFYYSITLVSVMLAGHLGKLELAGATLANSWATVTGLAFMVCFPKKLLSGFGFILYF